MPPAATMGNVRKEPVKAEPPKPKPLFLRGVVRNSDGARIAILAQGEDGAALTVGETWHGYTLRAMTDHSVILDAADGTITLTRE